MFLLPRAIPNQDTTSKRRRKGWQNLSQKQEYEAALQFSEIMHKKVNNKKRNEKSLSDGKVGGN